LRFKQRKLRLLPLIRTVSAPGEGQNVFVQLKIERSSDEIFFAQAAEEIAGSG
jgi:hypothetical protein